MYLKYSISLAFAMLALATTPAVANDARSIALGGLAVTNGQGVHGVAANPATLMHLKRKGRHKHLRFGAAADFRDPGEFVQTAIDNSNLANDITTNIEDVSDSTLQCVTSTATADTVCLDGTEGIGENFQNILDILRQINLKPMEVLADATGGIGLTQTSTPVAVHFSYSLVAAGEIGLSANDISYLEVLSDALIDGELTIEDIANSFVEGTQILSLNDNLQTVEVARPEDFLTSRFGGNRLDRRQLAISLARTLNLGQHKIDIGVTPKFSSVTTFRAAGSVASEFDTSTPSIADDFKNAETNTSSFTLDVGATYLLNKNFGISAVARNLIPENIQSGFDGFVFETTPQFILGTSFFISSLKINADAAVNAAKKDGVLTQPFSLGAELGQGAFSLRGGISIDDGRRADKAAATLGFGLGPLQVGARISSLNAIQASVQLSYSF